MVVHAVRRDEEPLPPPDHRRTGVPQVVALIRHHAVLGDRPDAHHEAVGGEPRGDPEKVEGRVAAQDQDGEQHHVGNGDAPEIADAREVEPAHAALRPAEVPPERRAGPLPPRLPGEVPPDLPPKARARHGERRREAQIRVLRGAGLRMVLQVIRAVRVQVAPDRVRTEPVADDVVQPVVPEERVVRGLVHEDGEAELAPADDEERDDDAQRVRRPGDQCKGAGHEPPVDPDRQPGAARAHREQRAPFGGREGLRPEDTGRRAFAGQHPHTLRRVPALSQGRVD